MANIPPGSGVGPLRRYIGASWRTILGYLNTISSNVQTQLNAKQASLPSKTGNSLKYMRVNAGETDFEYSTVTVGGSVTTVADLGATETIACSHGLTFKGTLTVNCAITLTAPPDGSTFRILLVQGGVGSYTVTWADAANIKWPGGAAPVLSTAVGAQDIISFVLVGTTYYGSFSLDMQVAP